MKPVIRAATLADAPALTRIHQSCFDEPWDAESFRRFLQGASGFALLGMNAAATELQSLILIQAVAGESEILSLGTVPGARRSGLARALVIEAAAEAARRAATTMFLEVAEDNSAALALYRGCGFAHYGRRRSYYGRSGAQPTDALMLRASLPFETPMGMVRRLD